MQPSVAPDWYVEKSSLPRFDRRAIAEVNVEAG